MLRRTIPCSVVASGQHSWSNPYRSATLGCIFHGMPNYRRFTVPGATLFFTVVTHQRRRFLVDPPARSCLRQAFQVVQQRYPFDIPAIVLLPDHLHALWTLPHGDAWSIRCAGVESRRSSQKDIWLWGVSRAHDRIRVSGGENGAVWQRRFWEHTIEDEFDFERHVDYIHYNPVKHCLVTRPHECACAAGLARTGL